jgi:lysozyme
MLAIPPEFRQKLRANIMDAESYRQLAYTDTAGRLTIGYGRNISTVGVSNSEALYLLGNDISRAERDIWHFCPWYEALDNVRKIVIVEIVFNVGIGDFLTFHKTIQAIEDKDYTAAAREMLDSKWATQVGRRAKRLALTMETGIL